MASVESGDLGATQRLLWRLIREPSGVEHALRESGDAAGSGLAAQLRADRGLAPTARLSVYAHAYFQRIYACLAKDFGALERSLGAAAFHDLVKLYLFVRPPHHFSLRFAGRELSEFLAEDPAAAFFRERWPFAADLAALEWALLDAFDAPDAPVLERAALAALIPEAWPTLRLRTSPSLTLLSLAWPVHVLRERFDAECIDPPTVLESNPTHICAWRQDERVFHRTISSHEAEALETIRSGEPFAALCEAIERRIGAAQTPLRAAAWLERWLADGILCAAF